MGSRPYSFEQFDTLFYPKHIAFIGASEKSALGSMLYLEAFKDSKWVDTFYPVNPKYDKILDWKCYHSVSEIPFPIDTAYVSVKAKLVPIVLKECITRKIKWVIIFSSGFSELGTDEGLQYENQIKLLLETNSEEYLTRVIGPNCLGPFNSESGIAFSFSLQKGERGEVSFMSQSGGHLNLILDIGEKRDIRYRYGVSFGNQIDLNCIDFLRHYRNDDKTKVIAAYLESFGSGNGHDFFLELKKTTREKPVIIWKGGYTEDGKRAAFSHTGAIASNIRLWSTMSAQTGAILVKDSEEFWNAMKTFELFYPKYIPKGRRIGIITPGGGNAVNSTDLFSSHNLRIPELSSESQNKLAKILPKENVNISNPIDLGAFGFVIDIFIDCLKVLGEDENVDIIVIPLWGYFLYKHIMNKMINVLERNDKPYAFIMPSIADSEELAQRFSIIKKTLHKQRILYYLSTGDAARSIAQYCDYIDFLRRKNSE
ncbi:MAG: CoA-binding protein [Candidatus Thorarchaeota archaeon]